MCSAATRRAPLEVRLYADTRTMKIRRASRADVRGEDKGDWGLGAEAPGHLGAMVPRRPSTWGTRPSSVVRCPSSVVRSPPSTVYRPLYGHGVPGNWARKTAQAAVAVASTAGCLTGGQGVPGN